MKTCSICHETKEKGCFYGHPSARDGLLNRCKECHKKAIRENRRSKSDYYRAYDRKRGNRQGYSYVKSYRATNPAKYKAQNAVNNALRDGRLEKPDYCEECGAMGHLEGHHDDYIKPLSVRWLCAACHKNWHAENGEGENAHMGEVS